MHQNHADFQANHADTTLFAALLEAAGRLGGAREAVVDAEGQPLTYKRLVLGALVLGSKLAALTRRKEAIGILLPNVNGLVVTLFGLNAFGRVAAFLNFTAGERALRSAVETAEITTVVTSRRFVELAKLEDVVTALESTEGRPGVRVRIIYLEDVRAGIGLKDKIVGAARALRAAATHARYALAPEEPAVILFTSGTEGSPKGVVLSNRNLVANADQMYAHGVDIFTPSDIIFNPLPMFHSFGLTVGAIMPVLKGMKVVLYPTPLHYKQIPALIRAAKATILFSTDTFLQGYGRAAEPGDLDSVRFVIAGAERVKEPTRVLWRKWGTTLLEGYGVTETAPVLSCNVPSANREGTVGRLLPGIEARLDPVEGITEGGRLVVHGANVMLGYLLHERPGVLVPTRDGWHDTGDIVTIDAEGFITIRGRARRFAKIGGEMISLAAVESMVTQMWPDSNHVVVSIPDPRKGEQLVLVTERADVDKGALLHHAQNNGFPELWVPRAILVTPHIPSLPTGKVDLQATTELAKQARPML